MYYEDTPSPFADTESVYKKMMREVRTYVLLMLLSGVIGFCFGFVSK